MEQEKQKISQVFTKKYYSEIVLALLLVTIIAFFIMEYQPTHTAPSHANEEEKSHSKRLADECIEYTSGNRYFSVAQCQSYWLRQIAESLKCQKTQ